MNNLEFMNLKENTTHGDFILPFTTYDTWSELSFYSNSLA